MARNRKVESAATRFAPALKALLLCGFFIAAGVGYVAYKSQTKALGDEVKACENTLNELRRKNNALRDQIKVLSSPVALEAQVKRLNAEKNLGLGPPVLTQVIRLVETAPEPAASASLDSSAFVSRQPRAGAGRTN